MSPRGAGDQRVVVASLTLLAILLVAGIVHIASLLILPQVAPDDAFARLSSVAPETAVALLPRGGSAAAPVPDRDPSAASAVCRYDLERGPLRVSAALDGEGLVAVTLHARSGVAFYGLDDRAGIDDRLELVVMTREQLDAAKARDDPASPVRDVRVAAPQARGFVMFDVLPRVGGYVEARRALSSMSCSVEHPG